MAYCGLAKPNLLCGALDTPLAHDCIEDNKQVKVQALQFTARAPPRQNIIRHQRSSVPTLRRSAAPVLA
jgi:hypothetical protein